MIKKLLTVGITSAFLFVGALPTFASFHLPTTTNTGTVSDNNVVAISNTGLNEQTGGKIQRMHTGDAGSTALQGSTINSPLPDSNWGSTTNKGNVKNNNVIAVSNTGLNTQMGGNTSHHHEEFHSSNSSSGGIQTMTTGMAVSDAEQWNTINSSISMP